MREQGGPQTCVSLSFPYKDPPTKRKTGKFFLFLFLLEWSANWGDWNCQTLHLSLFIGTHTRTHTRRYCFVGGSGANGAEVGKLGRIPFLLPSLIWAWCRGGVAKFPSLSFWRNGFRWLRPRTFGQCSCKHFCYMRHFWTIATNIGTISLANPNIKRSYAYHTLN